MTYSSELKTLLTQWHAENKKIVLVTGVFDMLHHAHKTFLKKAKQEGDILIVGLECDLRVTQIKGPGRPINAQGQRLDNLEKLNLADYVFILPQEFNKPEHHLQLLHFIKPAILAVSSHTKHLDKKQAMMQGIGGEVKVVMEHDLSISTSILIQDS